MARPRCLRSRTPTDGGEREPALLVLGLLGTSWIYLADLVHTRSGYNLRYLSAFAAPLLLIVAAGVGASRWSRVETFPRGPEVTVSSHETSPRS